MNRPLTALTALAALTLTAGPALAEFHFAIDGDYAINTNDGLRSADSGPHVGARIGWAFGLPMVDLVLEARGTTLNFPSTLAEEKDGWGGWGAQGGLRVGVDIAGFRPALFAHGGYGQTEVQGSDYSELHNGYLIDAGLSTTFTLLPVVGIGAQVAYNWLIEEEHTNTALERNAEWISFGLHLEFRL